jgi:hypothetical protein
MLNPKGIAVTYAETALHGHYVTVRANSRLFALLAGPFLHRRQAEQFVDAAACTAREIYRGTEDQAKLSFAAYGVARLTFKPGAPRWEGKLNTHLRLTLDPHTGYVYDLQP